MPINTVLFDLDGTLVEHGHALLPPLLAEWGYPRSYDDVKEAVARQIHYFYNHVGAAEEQGWIPELYRQFYHRVLEQLNVPDADDVNSTQVQTFFDAQPVPPIFDDVLPTVEKLHADGWRLGIITQRGRIGADRFVSEHGLSPYFPVIVAGDDGHGRKPGTGPFLKALELLDADPTSAVYIGDRIDDDCEGAAGAGLDAFLIDREGLFVLEADQRDDFTHLTDLADLFRHLPDQPHFSQGIIA